MRPGGGAGNANIPPRLPGRIPLSNRIRWLAPPANFRAPSGCRVTVVTFANQTMKALLKEIRHNPLLWLLVFVPVVFVAAKVRPDAHTLLFVLSVFAIVPLAALLSHA